MCKNLFIAGLSPEVSKKKLWDFLIASTEFMTRTDAHGLGFAAMSNTGLWGERWLNPNQAWSFREEWTETEQKILKHFKGTLKAEPLYNTFGQVNTSHTHAVIFHARMATCEKSLANTHPFVRDDVALIHNGVIRNTHELKNITSTCDSECILNEYVEADVMNNPADIQKVVNKIKGYYCCGVLSKDVQGEEHLDIFRSNGARLCAYWVNELAAVVFCTSDEIITNTCKKLKWRHSTKFEFKDDVMIRVNAKTGEFMEQYSYKLPLETYPRWNDSQGYYGYQDDDEKKNSLAIAEELGIEVLSGSKEMITSANKTSTNSTQDQSDAGSSDPFFVKGEGYAQSGR